MGVAYYIALDLEDVGFDEMVDGKTLANFDQLLNEVAEANGLPEMVNFFGMSGEELGDILGEENIPDCDEWHDSSVGAEYFASLARLVEKRPDASQLLVEELQEFASVLRKAHVAGAKWRLAMDI